MNIETKLTDEETNYLLVNMKDCPLDTVDAQALTMVKTAKAVAKAQDAKTKRVIAEWLMNYIDINLEEIIPDDKYTLFFIPNDKLKAIKKWALGE